MIQVKFIDVGRDKKTWVSEFKELTWKSLVTAIRKSGALMSRDIGVSLSDDETHGLVFAGIRAVGKFEVVKAQQPIIQATA